MTRVFVHIAVAIVVWVCCSPLLTAQRLTGQYVVIDSAVVGRVDDESAVATRTFRYNDTVRAVRRIDDTIIVKYRDLAYRLPLKSVVKEKEFKRYRRTVAVISDSAEVRTDQSTIWVRKGAVLPYLGDEDADRLRVQIYVQPATIRRADVLVLKADPQNQTSTDTDEEDAGEQRPYRVRLGASIGVITPLDESDVLDGGFSWAVSADVRLGGNNTFITAGYASGNFSFEPWTEIVGSAYLDLAYLGIIVGFSSEAKPVMPYTSLALGLMEGDDVLIQFGAGLDIYVTPQALAYIEVLPAFHVDSGTFVWLPLRAGFKFGF